MISPGWDQKSPRIGSGRAAGVRCTVCAGCATVGGMSLPTFPPLPPPDERPSIGRRAYLVRAAGGSWRECAERAHAASEVAARATAWRWAQTHAKAWPPEVDGDGNPEPRDGADGDA